MSAAPQFRLKQPSGWFAAGHEIDEALGLLSDGAFRLFMWLCLHADRGRGSVRASNSELTQTLGRGKEQIAADFDELLQKRVCILYKGDVIEIADRFWPYQRTCDSAPATELAGIAGIGNLGRVIEGRRQSMGTLEHAPAFRLHNPDIPNHIDA